MGSCDRYPVNGHRVCGNSIEVAVIIERVRRNLRLVDGQSVTHRPGVSLYEVTVRRCSVTVQQTLNQPNLTGHAG